MIRKISWVLAALAVLSGPVWGITLDPLKGWVTSIHLDKAIDHAKKKACPIVFLYARQEGGGDVVRARVYMRLPGLSRMVRVLVYESARPPTVFQQVADQVEKPNEDLPVMYIATPELKILGFVQPGAHKKTANRVITHVKTTMSWIKKSKANIASAEKGAKIGRFGTLLETCKRINAEDKQAAVRTTATWNVGLSKDEVDAFYFPELLDRIDAIEGEAEAYLAKVRAEFELKHYEKARKMVYPMAKDKGELAALTEAAALLKKIDDAMKTKP